MSETKPKSKSKVKAKPGADSAAADRPSPTPRAAIDAARWAHAVADATRLTLLAHLAGSSRTVSELSGLTKVEMVNVSHHLGVLKNARVVGAEKNGRFVVYTLNPEAAAVGPAGLTVTHDTGLAITIPKSFAPEPAE